MTKFAKAMAGLFVVFAAAFALNQSAQAAELLLNGGFESGASGWSITPDMRASTLYANARTGSGYAYLSTSAGDPGNGLIGWMHQAVSIPSNIQSAQLSFWYNITSSEIDLVASDFMNVTIQDANGNYLKSVDIFSDLHKDPFAGSVYYHNKTLDITELKGQTIRVNFLALTNASLPTVFRVDDVRMSFVPLSETDLTLSFQTPICDQNPPIGPAVRLDWPDVSGAIRYDIYRNGMFYVNSALDSYFYNNTNISAGNTYSYRIRAIKSGSYVESNEIQVYFRPDICAVSCIDSDGDGYGSGCANGVDCNDSNQNARPGAVEQCDNIDNNCDGQIDEGCSFGDNMELTVMKNLYSPSIINGINTIGIFNFTAEAVEPIQSIRIEEIHFRLEKTAEIQVGDIWVFDPGDLQKGKFKLVDLGNGLYKTDNPLILPIVPSGATRALKVEADLSNVEADCGYFRHDYLNFSINPQVKYGGIWRDVKTNIQDDGNTALNCQPAETMFYITKNSAGSPLQIEPNFKTGDVVYINAYGCMPFNVDSSIIDQESGEELVNAQFACGSSEDIISNPCFGCAMSLYEIKSSDSGLFKVKVGGWEGAFFVEGAILPKPQCNDDDDNDNDGFTDEADPGCASETDDDEFNLDFQIKLYDEGVQVNNIEKGSIFQIYIDFKGDDENVEFFGITSDENIDGVKNNQWNYFDWDESESQIGKSWNAETKMKDWFFEQIGKQELWIMMVDKDNNSKIVHQVIEPFEKFSIRESPMVYNFAKFNKTVCGDMSVIGVFKQNLPTFVITHGWNQDSSNTIPSWMTDMSEIVKATGKINLIQYEWLESAKGTSLLPPNENTIIQESRCLTNQLENLLESYAYHGKIHFVAHSAGSRLVYSTVNELYDLGYHTDIMTALEAYMFNATDAASAAKNEIFNYPNAIVAAYSPALAIHNAAVNAAIAGASEGISFLPATKAEFFDNYSFAVGGLSYLTSVWGYGLGSMTKGISALVVDDTVCESVKFALTAQNPLNSLVSYLHDPVDQTIIDDYYLNSGVMNALHKPPVNWYLASMIDQSDYCDLGSANTLRHDHGFYWSPIWNYERPNTADLSILFGCEHYYDLAGTKNLLKDTSDFIDDSIELTIAVRDLMIKKTVEIGQKIYGVAVYSIDTAADWIVDNTDKAFFIAVGGLSYINLITNSPTIVSRQIHIPEDAGLMTCVYEVVSGDEGDTIEVFINNELVYTRMADIDKHKGMIASEFINVRKWKGQDVGLSVRINSFDNEKMEIRLYSFVFSELGLIKKSDTQDIDQDGLPDFWEIISLNSLSENAESDSDGDGLNNHEEMENFTNPQSSDTDEDGTSDKIDNLLDQIPPTTRIILEGEGNAHANIYKTIKIGFEATDEGTGVKKTEYKIGETNEWQLLSTTSEIWLKEPGDYKLVYRSHDYAGNIENNQIINLKVISDTIAPATTPKFTGTVWQNNWFVSEVDVRLNAQDNDGGVGVEKTMYSLDGGEWTEYATSTGLKIGADGRHKLDFYSVDWFGNQEATGTAEFKIDRTPPEARIGLDASTKKISVYGFDNLSLGRVYHHNGYKLVQDEAGHFLKIFYSELKDNPQEARIRITGLQYDSRPIVRVPVSNLRFSWTAAKSGQILELSEYLSQIGVMRMDGKFKHQTGSTYVRRQQPVHDRAENQTVDDRWAKKETLPGLRIFNLTTAQGTLAPRY